MNLPLRTLYSVAFTCVAVALSTADAQAWPWSNDMMNQSSIKPQEKITPFPARSVPVTGIPSAAWEDREATTDLKNPHSPTPGSLKTGKVLFQIYCAACHGLSGRAESEVVKRGMPANDLTDDYVQSELTEGWIFGTITFGSAVMPPYGRAGDQNDEARGSNDLSVDERWHVVNYVKHQLRADAVAAGPLPEDAEEPTQGEN
ncbi:cytochrome c [Magnetovibrio sp.]|uniref:c-type cytochrome n=1 Tax=Magnetovibrio sp. TaxID=2024836 RepID=UPI002F931801